MDFSALGLSAAAVPSAIPAIRVPVLIVQGERDTFGTPEELKPAIATMKTKVTLHVVAGGDHSLSVRGKKKDEAFAEVLDVVVTPGYTGEVLGAAVERR